MSSCLDKFFTQKELLDLYKIKNLIRYNNKTKLHNENVAEHSYFVALLGLKLCDKYCLSNHIKRKVMIKALLHDIPEMYINDITYDAKMILNISHQLKEFEKKFYKTEYPRYFNLMKDKNDLVSTIVVTADILSAKQYILNEFELGNKSSDIIEINKQLDERLNKQYALLTTFKEIKKYETSILGN